MPEIPGCGGTALSAPAPNRQGDEHTRPCVGEVGDINVRILELVPDPAAEPLIALRSPIHAAAARKRSRWDELAVRGNVGHRGVEVAALERGERTTHHLHVLLRHRPRRNYGRDGHCWARTSDLRLVEAALSQLS